MKKSSATAYSSMVTVFAIVCCSFVPDILLAQPRITSVAPLFGPAGTVVTITGSNFGINPADNIVQFGAVRAQLISASLTSIKAIVPTGTTYTPLTLTTAGSTIYALVPFLSTFQGNGTLSMIEAERLKGAVGQPWPRKL